jgi:hypothetical protein
MIGRDMRLKGWRYGHGLPEQIFFDRDRDRDQGRTYACSSFSPPFLSPSCHSIVLSPEVFYTDKSLYIGEKKKKRYLTGLSRLEPIEVSTSKPITEASNIVWEFGEGVWREP